MILKILSIGHDRTAFVITTMIMIKVRITIRYNIHVIIGVTMDEFEKVMILF